MAARHTSYIGISGRKMAPTKKHRAVIWECMFGTVYARNAEDEIKYFDYDYDGAKLYAGIAEAQDIRVFKTPSTHTVYTKLCTLNKGRVALFVLEGTVQ